MTEMVLDIGLALALIAIAGAVSARLRMSIVPALVIAGMVVGPHAPSFGMFDLRFIRSNSLIEFMGSLGVIFLLFYLGLEFSIGRLIRAGHSILKSGLIYMVINLPLAVIFCFAAGWGTRETLVAIGIIIISSSAIVAKLLTELKRTANPETELILGLMMFQDVFVAVYLAIVSGVISGKETSIVGLLIAIGIIIASIIGVLILGRKALNLLNRLLDIDSDELFLLAIFSFLLITVGSLNALHIEEAIGSLLVGLILSETEHAKRIEHLLSPFRDLFGAIFFFYFGLTINPFALGGAVWLALGAVAITLVGSYLTGKIAGKATGLTPRASFVVGMSILSRGEFSIIMARLAQSEGLAAVLQPFTALYVLLMAIIGPLLTKEAKSIFRFLNRSKVSEPSRER